VNKNSNMKKLKECSEEEIKLAISGNKNLS
jgi:hypothetical protein